MWIPFTLTHLRSTGDVVSIFILYSEGRKTLYGHTIIVSQPLKHLAVMSEGVRNENYFPIVLHFQTSFYGVCLTFYVERFPTRDVTWGILRP